MNRDSRDAHALSHEWCSVLDPQGITLYVNPVGEALFHADAANPLVGQPWLQRWPHTEHHKVQAAMADAWRQGQAQFEATCPTASGALRRWEVLLTASPASSPHSPNTLVCMARDVSAPRHASPDAPSPTEWLGQMVRERTKLLSDLHAHMVDTMEQHRKQLARELHDEMGSLLTMMSFEVARLKAHLGDGDDATIPPEVSRLDTLIGHLRDYKHRVIAGLRPPLLQELGLELALLTFIEQYSQSSGMAVNAAIDNALPPLRESASLAVFRLIQECLTNVAKYAQASAVHIDLTCDNTHLVIEVSDNGIGLPPHALNGSRFGLVGMRERIQAFGGTTQFERINDAGGTRITASLPLAAICEPRASPPLSDTADTTISPR